MNSKIRDQKSYLSARSLGVSDLSAPTPGGYNRNVILFDNYEMH